MNSQEPQRRQPLNRARILWAAIDLADRAGLDALTMRRLGGELGVEAMALYKHVANKDAILDGMVELVVGSIARPEVSTDWKDAMRRRCGSARTTFRAHSWAIALLESRGSSGPESLRHRDAVLGVLRSAGFSIDDAAHAFWVLDSFVYGHVIQETSIPIPDSGDRPDPSELEEMRTSLPHLAEMIDHATDTSFSFDEAFTQGLDLLLDALEGRLG